MEKIFYNVFKLFKMTLDGIIRKNAMFSLRS